NAAALAASSGRRASGFGFLSSQLATSVAVHAGVPLVSSILRHTATRNVHRPSAMPSASQDGSPSMQLCVRLTTPLLSRYGWLSGAWTLHCAMQSLVDAPPPAMRSAP